jgi:hypothetical protein
VTSHGVETARYNSLLHYQHQGTEEYAVFSCGNRLILFDYTLNQTLIDQKVINDAIMVITQCRKGSGRLLLCSYDGHIAIVQVFPELKSFILEQDIMEFCEKDAYRYVRHASLNGDQVAFVSEQGKDSNKIVTFKAS